MNEGGFEIKTNSIGESKEIERKPSLKGEEEERYDNKGG
jgi:hypothetical protein